MEKKRSETNLDILLSNLIGYVREDNRPLAFATSKDIMEKYYRELDEAREEGRIQQLKEDIEQVKIFLPEQVSDTDKYWIPTQILLELESDLSKLNGKQK